MRAGSSLGAGAACALVSRIARPWTVAQTLSAPYPSVTARVTIIVSALSRLATASSIAAAIA